MSDNSNKMTVRVDQENNRLYCSWEGNVSKQDFGKFFTDIRFAVADLKPDFSVINDLSRCKYCHVSGIQTFQRAMQYLLDHGLKDIVRVVDSNSLIFAQIFNLASRTQGYIPVYVNSLDEAEEFLNNKTQRGNIRLKMFNKSVDFKVDGQWSQGQLQDISLSGCAIATDADSPENGETLQVAFALPDKKMLKNKFTIKAEVARCFAGGFAVSFTKFQPVDLTKLTECMAQSVLENLSK